MADDKLIEKLVKKVDGLAADVRTNSFKLDRIETMVGDLASNIKTLSGQFGDVGVMAIKDTKRIDGLEKRVGDLESGVH